MSPRGQWAGRGAIVANSKQPLDTRNLGVAIVWPVLVAIGRDVPTQFRVELRSMARLKSRGPAHASDRNGFPTGEIVVVASSLV